MDFFREVVKLIKRCFIRIKDCLIVCLSDTITVLEGVYFDKKYDIKTMSFWLNASDKFDATAFGSTPYYKINPFGSYTIIKVMEKIKDTFNNNPRKIRIIYNQPNYQRIIDQLSWLEREKNLSNMIIWRSKESNLKGT